MENVKKFKNKNVYKMKIYASFPSFSLQLFHNDRRENLISEMVFWNANISFLRFLDYRKTIELNSFTMFLLCPCNE